MLRFVFPWHDDLACPKLYVVLRIPARAFPGSHRDCLSLVCATPFDCLHFDSPPPPFPYFFLLEQTVLVLRAVLDMTPNPKKVKKAKGAGNERLAAVVGEVLAATRACATELLRLCEALRGVFAADATAEWAPLAGNASDDAADSSEAVRRYWFDVTQCAAPLAAQATGTRVTVLKKLRDSQRHSSARLRSLMDDKVTLLRVLAV